MNKIAIICDLSPSSGFGHLKRMICLSKSVEKKGDKCIFFFEKKNLNFIKKYTKNLNIIFINKISNPIFLSNFLIKLQIFKVILDSYKLDYKFEKYLINKNFIVVAIDDHYKKHAANIVVSNRSEKLKITFKKNKQIWLNGPQYSLINIKKKKLIHVDKKKILKNYVLLHAGGASLYNKIKVLVISLLMFLQNKDIGLAILCTTPHSKKYIINLCSKNKIKIKIKFIKYINNFSSTFSKYDIIFGPAGTTTFEIISSGSLPFSFPLINDGRDSQILWLKLGHLMHFNSKEIINKKILFDSFDLVFRKRSELLSIVNKNSKLIDGKGPDRVANFILEKNKNSSFYKSMPKKNILKYSYEICSCLDLRNFMESRNHKSSRDASFNPGHIITWPEHVKWWLDKNILKYKVKEGDITVAYYWLAVKKDILGNFVESGWFLEKNISSKNNTNYKLKITLLTLKFKANEAKKIYRKVIWIATMNKKNKFIKILYKNVGFKDPSKLSVIRAKNNYNNIEFSKTFEVMEMCL